MSKQRTTELDFTPVVRNCEQITCLDSWYSSLLVGTRTGVQVFKTVGTGNAFAGVPHCVILPSTPIQQLNVAEFWNYLFVLYGEKLDVYELGNNGSNDNNTNKKHISPTKIYTFPHGNIEKFSLWTERESMRVCIAVPGQIIVYYHDGSNFNEGFSFPFPHAVYKIVLASLRLYIAYQNLELRTSVECFQYALGEDTAASIISFNSIIDLLLNYEFGSVLVHWDCTSFIFSHNNPVQKLAWRNPPSEIVRKGSYCIGVTRDGVEAVSPIRSRLSCEIDAEDALHHITGKAEIYVAGSSEIWRLIIPPEEDCPQLNEPVTATPTSGTNFEFSACAINSSDPPLPSHESEQFPETFSPGDPLSVVGLNAEEQEKFCKEGITTVRQFAWLNPTTVKHIFQLYWGPYCTAVNFMHHYDAQSRSESYITKNDEIWASEPAPSTPPSSGEDDEDCIGAPDFVDSPLPSSSGDFPPLLEYFSPEDPISVLGLGAEARNKMAQCRITTVKKLAEITPTTDLISLPHFWAHDTAQKYMGQFNKMKKSFDIWQTPQVNPEDPLEVIGMAKHQIEFLASMMVFTVRQFAKTDPILDELDEFRVKAVEAMLLYDISLNENSNMYGYVHLSTSELSHFLDDRILKSRYTLFQEFMNCEQDAKADHPWKSVYQRLYDKVKHEMGFGDDSFDPSDADVFAFIISQFVSSIGELDFTATSRAIFFSGNSQSTQHSHTIQINLTSLCEAGGKLFGRTNITKWTPMTIQEYKRVVLNGKEMHFGCIVMPSGTINWEDIVYCA